MAAYSPVDRIPFKRRCRTSWTLFFGLLLVALILVPSTGASKQAAGAVITTKLSKASFTAVGAKRPGYCRTVGSFYSYETGGYCLNASISNVTHEIKLGKTYTYKVTVRNTGTKPIKRMKVLAWDSRFITGSSLRFRRRPPDRASDDLPMLRWDLTELQPGKTKQFEIRVKYSNLNLMHESSGALGSPTCGLTCHYYAASLIVRVTGPWIVNAHSWVGSQTSISVHTRYVKR